MAKKEEKQVNLLANQGDQLDTMIGQPVLLMCMNYFYHGTLVGVNFEQAMLSEDDAVIVYETGPWSDAKWKDSQKLGRPVVINRSAIESFMRGK